ncbi:unnamed protein product, partial [Amoebophrya sp. A25]|eukprot:GSA25T00014091001.1
MALSLKVLMAIASCDPGQTSSMLFASALLSPSRWLLRKDSGTGDHSTKNTKKAGGGKKKQHYNRNTRKGTGELEREQQVDGGERQHVEHEHDGGKGNKGKKQCRQGDIFSGKGKKAGHKGE